MGLVHLGIGNIKLSKKEDLVLYSLHPDNNGGPFGSGLIKREIKVDLKINHEGEVRCARYMPQNSQIIATKTSLPDVLIFNIGTHRTSTAHTTECNPILRLKGYATESYGLSWNPNTEGDLLSTADDYTICLWNVNKQSGAGINLDPLSTCKGDGKVVEDIAWNCKHPTTFGSVRDDKKLMIWDIRTNNSIKPSLSVNEHIDKVNCVTDKTLALWDSRQLKRKLATFESHKHAISRAKWSPQYKTIFASSDPNERLCIWNFSLGQIHPSETPIDGKDDPPELLFTHGGQSKIWDFSWIPNEPSLICPVCENKTAQVWQMLILLYY
ncbi:unnamed protein product [Adineta steineri]|uniref:Uncharacterized protein n=1 Tax=Adineta steineri TaxID=433720 RepID=A0A815B3N3_9BILA|nr:unnamed protein product [Adineta steineri]CAF3736719.1 unnamed protein product [Adineta steineri]